MNGQTKTSLCVVVLCWLLVNPAVWATDTDLHGVPFDPPKEISLPTAVPDEAVAPENASSVPPPYLKNMSQASLEAKVVINKCKEQYLLGEMKTHARLVRCINPGFIAAYKRAGYPYPDLLQQINSRRLAIARQVDAKTVSEAQGEAMLADFSKQIAAEERKRNEKPKMESEPTSNQ